MLNILLNTFHNSFSIIILNDQGGSIQDKAIKLNTLTLSV